jgi:hypothetical protein
MLAIYLFRKPLWILVFVACTLFSFSQSSTNSPYSRYGIGDLQSGSFTNTIPMGGLYHAIQNDSTAPYYINASNPASHATVRLTVFDIGYKHNTTELFTHQARFRSGQSILSNLSLAFPVAKWWGASFGLIPYSSIGYKIRDTARVDSIGKISFAYEGEGGINQVYFGNGFRYKRLYAGVNVSYLFGNLTYTSRDSFAAASTFYNTKYYKDSRISDFNYTFGLQYNYALKKNWQLIVGTTGTLATRIAVKKTEFAATYKVDAGVENLRDTVLYKHGIKDTITLPLSVGTGIVLKKTDRWIIGFDYSVQNWAAAKPSRPNSYLKNSTRLALGAQYIPNKSAGVKDPYYKKIFYRMGIRYADSYVELKNTTIKDYALCMGAGFPLRKYRVGEMYSQSIVNVGLEYGTKGTTEQGLIREKYFNIVVGITLNDRWFIKRKYD